jgi:hypothetical protein
MLKVIAAIALLGSVSTIAIVSTSDSSLGSRTAFKVNAATRNYVSPRLAGKPVVFCLSGGSQCGKPAADAFCRSNRFEKAVTFQRDGVQLDPAKLRFRQIKCWRPQVAAEPDIIIQPAGVSLTSNTAAKSDQLTTR